jgi:hypothetical protein
MASAPVSKQTDSFPTSMHVLKNLQKIEIIAVNSLVRLSERQRRVPPATFYPNPSLPRSGRGGRRFKSCHADQYLPKVFVRSGTTSGTDTQAAHHSS